MRTRLTLLLYWHSRMMSDSISSPKYPTWASAARSIWREGRLKAVYRGFLPCILRAFPTVSQHTPASLQLKWWGLQLTSVLIWQNGGALFVWETSMRLMNAEKVRWQCVLTGRLKKPKRAIYGSRSMVNDLLAKSTTLERGWMQYCLKGSSV